MASSDPNVRLNSIAREDESKGATVHSFNPDATPQQKAATAGKALDKVLPIKQDTSSGGQELPFDTGSLPIINVEDADRLPRVNGSPEVTLQPSLPGDLSGLAPSIPHWYKVGWRAVGGFDTPHIGGVEKELSVLAAFLHEQYYGQWYYNAGIIFFAVFTTHFLTRFNFGWAWLIIILAVCSTYYSTSMARFRRRVRDDVQRELVKTSLPAETESAEWLNHFLERFWRIYEPVLSASIVNFGDQILSANCPPFLDSIQLSTFTLGNKSFKITQVRTFPHAEEENVIMEWSISFQPSDTSDMTQDEIKKKVNSKIVLSIRLGKGLATASMPVLLEDLSFSGVMRVRMKLMTNFPHIQLVDLSFLGEPHFDYSLKPIGGDTFGFDIAHIPGLSAFIRDMVHSTLRPMMYDPNVFTLNLEQLLSGTPLDSAIGVLQVSIHSARGIKSTKLGGGSPDPFVSLSINNRATLAKTQYKRNTFNPTWMETKFFLINSLTEPLVLSLYDYNEHTSHHLMGAATFDLQILNDDASLDSIKEKILKDGKDHGEIGFDVKFYPTLSPTSDGGATTLPETNVGIVRLVVHQAKDLDSTKSVFGGHNTFVKVYLGKQVKAIHKSALVKHTNNPTWESAAEFLCANRQTSVVTIKVIDDRDFMKDPVIGHISVRVEDLLEAREYPGKDWWMLTGCNNGRIRLSTEWKPVQMAGSLYGANRYVPPIGVVRLWLHKATDVKNVEATLGGKSDPYVRVQVKNVILARTEVINNDLNPVWDQIVYVPVHSLKESLLLECMDYQHITKDRSLGSVDLQVSELATKVDAVDYHYKSTGKKTVVDPIRQDKAQTFKGQLHYEAEFIPAIALCGVEFKARSDRKNAAKDNENDTTGDANSDGMSVSSLEADHHSGFVSITATVPIGVDKIHKSTESTDAISSINSNVANDTDIAGEKGPASSTVSVSHVSVDGTEDKEQDKEEEQGVSMSKEELLQHQSGVVVFNIIGGKLSKKARLEVLLDDGYWPVFSTTFARSINASWELIGEGFIRELDFGQVWFRLNEAHDGDKDDIIGEWKEDAKKFLEEALDGPVFRTLLSADEKSVGTIQLQARYVPAPVKLEPRETINNQGTLSVVLLDGHDILAIDRGGTSDPFAVFTLNGQRVHKSQTKKKTLSPEWNENFQVLVPSRFNANFQVELFDWNQIEQAKTLGVGRIELSDLEPFQGIERIIPLSNKHGEKGQLRLTLNFRPQIIVKSRKNTSTFSTAGRAMTQIGSLPVEAGKGVFHGVTGVFKHLGHLDKEEDVRPVSPTPSEQASHPVASYDNGGGGALLPSMNTESQVANTNLPGTLRVTVLDAKNFNTSSEPVKPYVVLRCGDKELKTKHASKTMAECSWNESFTFIASPATQPKMYVWIFDYKTLTKNKQLGTGEIDIWRHLKSTGVSSADVLVELREGQGQLKVHLKYDPDEHPLRRTASFSSERVVSSSSRFSIRSLRPGTSNDD